MLAAASLELKAEKQDAHSGTIWSVGFSPDGKTIVSGSWDQTIKVWDANPSPDSKTAEYIRSLMGKMRLELERAARALAWKPIKVWDAGTSTAGTHPPDSPP